jgi:hypothetical protein
VPVLRHQETGCLYATQNRICKGAACTNGRRRRLRPRRALPFARPPGETGAASSPRNGPHAHSLCGSAQTSNIDGSGNETTSRLCVWGGAEDFVGGTEAPTPPDPEQLTHTRVTIGFPTPQEDKPLSSPSCQGLRSTRTTTGPAQHGRAEQGKEEKLAPPDALSPFAQPR